MGAKIAFRHKDTIYLVAEFSPKLDLKQIEPRDFGIIFEDDNFVVAEYERNDYSYVIQDNKQWFTVTGSTIIDKSFIVNQIINPLFEESVSLNIIDDDEKLKKSRLFIVSKKNIFQVLDGLSVLELCDYGTFSHIEPIIYSYLRKLGNNDSIDYFAQQLISKLYQHFNEFGRYFVLYNTNSRAFKLIEAGDIL